MKKRDASPGQKAPILEKKRKKSEPSSNFSSQYKRLSNDNNVYVIPNINTFARMVDPRTNQTTSHNKEGGRKRRFKLSMDRGPMHAKK